MAFLTKDYKIADTTVRYITDDSTGRVTYVLLPCGTENSYADFCKTEQRDDVFMDHYDFHMGGLVHLHIAGDILPPFPDSYKFSPSMQELKFENQAFSCENGKTVIATKLTSDRGYSIIHELVNYEGENAFEVYSTFKNEADKTFRIDLMTSATLDHLSPYRDDSSTEDMRFHEFYSRWAMEGRHVCREFKEFSMDKSWGGSFENEKIGALGSRNVGGHFPFVAVEDTKEGVTWAMQLAHPSSWQAELTRCGRQVSLSIGLADRQYGHWFKDVAPGETFTAPTAYISAVKGDIADACYEIINTHHRDIDAYGEEGMPIICNEYCMTWCNPDEEKMIALAEKLKDSKVKYLVMDAGWFDDEAEKADDKNCDGYYSKKDKFPHGMKYMCDEIRKRGKVPGIWMEYERPRPPRMHCYAEEWQDLMLKKDGAVIELNQVKGKFWDLRKHETIEFLDHDVIDQLNDNGFGYLKIDYNANAGYGCDGAESSGEGMRQQMLAVCEFVKRIKEKVPGIIIENCASGGYRLEPSMMAITAMSSFSDAHECVDFPIVAANLHYLIPARQSQVWVTLRKHYGKERFAYSIAAGFLGRLCWSGDILDLEDWQFNEMMRTEALYEKVAEIIKYGKSRIYQSQVFNYRKPEGTQVVVRKYGDKALVTLHYMYNPDELEIDLDGNYKIAERLYNTNAEIKDGKLIIGKNAEINGDVLVLEKI